MFGAKYSRMKFWLINLPVIFIGLFIMGMTEAIGSEGTNAIASLIVFVILIHFLANRIRGFGSNPWLALWAILPLVGLFQALYYGCKKSGEMPQTELKSKKSSVASASVEKTLEYETEEGKVREKSTVDYNVDKGNAIDNIVNSVTESKSVQKAASFINKTIRLGLSGVGGIMAGAGIYNYSRYTYSHYDHGRVWDLPESTVIGASILVGLIAFPIIFTIYSKIFMNK